MLSVATGTFTSFTSIEKIERTKTTRELKDDVEVLHRQVLDLTDGTADLRRRSLILDLDDTAEESAKKSPLELLEAISDSGMSWRDVARIVRVTYPAIQKWRHGGHISGANRLKLGQILALLDVLDRNMINEGASWLEMPVKEGVSLSRLDMWAGGRVDLVLELISDNTSTANPDSILDRFDSNWRNTLIDDMFEPFTAGDGYISIRSKR